MDNRIAKVRARLAEIASEVALCLVAVVAVPLLLLAGVVGAISIVLLTIVASPWFWLAVIVIVGFCMLGT